MHLQKFFLAGIIILAACHKKDSVVYVPCSPATSSSQRIAEESYYSGPDTTFHQRSLFIYDNSPEGRLVYRLNSQGGPFDTAERYTYLPGKILVDSIVIILNSQGLADTLFVLGSFKTWKYNSGGYLAEVNSGIGWPTDALLNYSCYNNDRVITRLQTNHGARTDTTYYQYYPDKLNTIGNENHGIYFYGRQNNNLLKSQVTGGMTVCTYTYVLDSSHRVQWEIRTDPNGNLTYRKFTYL